MSTAHTGNVQPAIDLEEHDGTGGVNSKRVQVYGYIPGTDTKVKITAIDNGDGTYSLKTSASLVGGGGDGAILDGVSSSIKATVLDLTSANPLTTAIVDGSGNQITSFGGGTQYADGAARGTATGTIAMGDDGTNIQSIKTDSSGVLAIQDNGGSITVDGTVAMSSNAEIGIVTETAPGTDTASSGLNGRLQRIAQRLTSLIALLPGSLGQKARAASLAVTLSSEDITALTPPAAITGYATSAAQTDKSQFTKITDGTDTALVTAAGEQNVLATAQPGVDIGDVTINNASGASAVNVQDGGNSLTIDAPVGTPAFVRLSDGAATLIGQKAMTASIPVVIASDQSAVPVSGSVTATVASTTITGTVTTKETRAATPAQTSVSVTASNTSVLASNANRLGATIYNEGSAICYLKLGATASLTSYTLQIASGGYYEVPFAYTGAIDGITSASTAQLRITEVTA
jgi:hypothetical protein